MSKISTKKEYADLLIDAYVNNNLLANDTTCEEITSPEEAYSFVYDYMIPARASLGESVLGYKIAAAAKKAQETFGVDEPIYGAIISKEPSKNIELSNINAPMVEPELVFTAKEDINPEWAKDPKELIKHFDISVGIEIPDGRFKDGNGKVSGIQYISDFGFARYGFKAQPVVLGYDEIAEVKGELFLNGELIGEGHSKFFGEHPADTLAWLITKLDQHKTTLKKGQYVFTGSFIVPVPLTDKPGTYEAKFDHFGSCTFEVV